LPVEWYGRGRMDGAAVASSRAIPAPIRCSRRIPSPRCRVYAKHGWSGTGLATRAPTYGKIRIF
jgi:hypothetical protein